MSKKKEDETIVYFLLHEIIMEVPNIGFSKWLAVFIKFFTVTRYTLFKQIKI